MIVDATPLNEMTVYTITIDENDCRQTCAEVWLQTKWHAANITCNMAHKLGCNAHKTSFLDI